MRFTHPSPMFSSSFWMLRQRKSRERNVPRSDGNTEASELVSAESSRQPLMLVERSGGSAASRFPRSVFGFSTSIHFRLNLPPAKPDSCPVDLESRGRAPRNGAAGPRPSADKCPASYTEGRHRPDNRVDFRAGLKHAHARRGIVKLADSPGLHKSLGPEKREHRRLGIRRAVD